MYIEKGRKKNGNEVEMFVELKIFMWKKYLQFN